MSKPGVFLATAILSAAGYVGPAVAQTSPCAGGGRIETFVTATSVFLPKFAVRPDLTNPGARALALGGAFSATADDVTASIANPAGLASIVKPQVQLELRPRQYPQVDSLPEASEVVLGDPAEPQDRGKENGLPLFAGVVMPLGDTFAIGLTAQRIYALSRTADRTDTTESNLPCFRTTAFNDAVPVFVRVPLYTFVENTDVGRAALSLSWRPAPRFALGATVFLARASLQTETTLQFVGGFRTSTREESTSTKAGVIGGVLYTPTEGIRLGLTYASGVQFSGENAAFNPTLPVSNANAYLVFAPVLLPSRITLGVNVALASNVTLSIDGVRVGWSELVVNASADDARIGSFSVANGLEIKGGLEWTVTETRTRRVDLRVGAFYESVPAIELVATPRSALRDDLDKSTQDLARTYFPTDADLSLVHVTGGLGVYLNKRIQIDVGLDYELDLGAVSASVLLGYSF